MADGKDVLIVGEVAHGGLASISGELAAAAGGLIQALGGDLIGVIVGDDVEGPAREMVALGVSRVYAVQDPLLQDPQAEPFLAAIAPVARQANPAVVLMGKTLVGRDVAPRLAFRLGGGFAQDCVGVSWDAERAALVAVRPVYGGASLARVAVRSTPAVAAIRPKAFDPVTPNPAFQGEVVSVSADLDPKALAVRLVERVQAEASGVRLEDARVVVSGGRGLGGPEAFQVLEELAGLLGGAVGASRAACDAGWIPHTHQVGLTGKSIAAELYITVGISGASQHLAGISGVKNVVAVNKDDQANIFKEARYGVVGDWAKVVPSFMETVRELVKS